MNFAIQTTFLPRENILFMEEWLEYHTSIGCNKFFLYNNEGSQSGYLGLDGYNRNGIDVMGLTSHLTDEQIKQQMTELFSQYPVVEITWQPIKNDKIYYDQMGAIYNFINFNSITGRKVKWVAFIDMDEFIVGDLNDCEGKGAMLLRQRKLNCRWDTYKWAIGKSPTTSATKKMPVYPTETWAPKVMVDVSDPCIDGLPNIHTPPRTGKPCDKRSLFIHHYNVSQGMLDWWCENYRDHDPNYAGGFERDTALTVPETSLLPFAHSFAKKKGWSMYD
jgi:Glycosyltransferase family 92